MLLVNPIMEGECMPPGALGAFGLRSFAPAAPSFHSPIAAKPDWSKTCAEAGCGVPVACTLMAINSRSASTSLFRAELHAGSQQYVPDVLISDAHLSGDIGPRVAGTSQCSNLVCG